jgi:hypothetical protein
MPHFLRMTGAKTFVNDVFCQQNKRIKAELSLLLILCIVILLTVSWEKITHNQITTPIEEHSIAYLNETMKTAGAAFLIARALNASISVLQSFTITPFIGELSLGEMLDPVNDLIERFSLVMLVVTVSLGIQLLLMEIGVSVNMTWIILPALFFILISLFIRTDKDKYLLRMLAYKLLLIVLLVRFAIPITGSVGAYISGDFLAEKRDTAMKTIEELKENISNVSIQEVITSSGKVLEKIQHDSQEIIAQMLKLMTLFTFETILFPLLVLWGLVKIFGMIFYTPLTKPGS